jgi:drug/metabolite transporter (DMT)-like permease
LASIAVLIPLVAIVPATAVTRSDLLWGGLGGIFGMLGILGLYTALSRGPMGVIAPVTAVLGAIVPVAVGLIIGERPESLALVGVVLGLVAIAWVSASSGPSGPIDRYAMIPAIVAGLGFGLFFVCLAQTDEAAGMWPLAAARTVSIPVAVLLAARTGSILPARSARPLAAGAGAVDMVANGFYVAAAQRGLMSVIAVLSALYPIGTVLLARVVLKERLSRGQLAAVGVAVVAIALIGVA